MTYEDGWQPIETAPKDGTEVLVWDDGCVVAAFFGRLGWQLTQTGAYAEDADLYGAPTHWRPLPEGPTP